MVRIKKRVQVQVLAMAFDNAGLPEKDRYSRKDFPDNWETALLVRVVKRKWGTGFVVTFDNGNNLNM